MKGSRAPLALAVPGFLILFLATAVPIALTRGAGFSREVEQPIAFNHRKHAQELDLACNTCHEYFEKEAFSGLPTADVCGVCHSEPQGKSAEERRLVQLLKTGAPLEWKPLFLQPPHVYYSHRRHVIAARIECPVCHGAIASTVEPPTRVTRLRMQDCLDCHRRRGAPTDCTTCHR